ncbi:hypothetical protein BGZ89_009280 [Linnemannia elongata]|nr:hypothetical protein BGZ89_009280 [Linnemannia elongata]
MVTNWSTVMEVFDRVLASEFGFGEAYLAARKGSMLDPAAELVHPVLYPFRVYGGLIADSNFGWRMRRRLMSALEFAAIIMKEKKQREGLRDAPMKDGADYH